MIRRVLLTLVLGLLLSGSAFADGKIYAIWEEADSEGGKLIRKHMLEKGIYAQLIRNIDQSLVMPRDMPVVFAEVGKVGAWYLPEKHAVLFSYELIGQMLELFDGHPDTKENALLLTDGAALFVLSHELGHAVIGELELPTTGKEEDCADEFATILASEELGDQGKVAALGAAAWFDLMSSGTASVEELAFWDEHSLDQQRAFKILCNLYAADPKEYAFVRDHVPAERLKLAQERYPRKVRNWMRLLAPHAEKK